MESKIKENELLYRAIKRSRRDWLDNEGKPTPAMYKDEGGNSVDRDGKRDEDSIINFMKEGIFKGRLKGVVKLYAKECMNEPYAVKIKSAPTKENPYHANIILNEENLFICDLQALKLADISTVIFINQNMEWI